MKTPSSCAIGRVVTFVATTVVAVTTIAGFAPVAAASETEANPPRLLVLSVPGLTWADVQRADLPNLESLFERGALANLAPRGVFARSGPGDAYLTISGGSRATTLGDIDGQVLGVDEVSTGSSAGDIFRRRTGEDPDGPFVSLSWPTLVRANAAQPFETELGLLADTLSANEVSASVIGNADGIDAVGESYERQVGLAIADERGGVPGGFLGKELLLADPDAAFGVRFAADAVLAQFRLAWRDAGTIGNSDASEGSDASDASGGGMVVVEASDLARTLRYRAVVDQARYDAMWDEALVETDALVGRILEELDPERDRVLVVAPYNQRGDRDLVSVALVGPEVEPGYLRSASTQRSGYLTLVDIGPTILDQFDITRPVAMEGRPAVVVASSESLNERVDHLVERNEAARFREQLLTPTTTVVVLVFAAVVALSIAAHANGWSRRARRAIAAVTVANLAIMPASYVARAFPLESLGIGFYWAFVLAFSVLVTVLATVLLVRRDPRLPLVAVLALMAGVLIVDVVSGSRLSLDAAFGYSATGNSRLYGISNYSYGQLAAATCLVAAWMVTTMAGRRGQVAGIAAMVVTLVVLGVPIWGSDVGGVLAFTPATAVFAVMVSGRRIKARTLVAGAIATAVAIAIFGALDLARAPSNRGHLGRLFERIGSEGPAPVLAMIERKLAANLEVSTSSLWVLCIPLGLAFWWFLRRTAGPPYRQIVAGFAALPAGLGAALTAGVLGSALNDSGAIIGGIMAMVVASALAVTLVEIGSPAPDAAPGEPVELAVPTEVPAAR